MLRAVIFDFDGVITDSELLHLRSFNDVLAQYGIAITAEDYYKNYLGLADLDLFGSLVEQGLLKIDRRQIRNLFEQKKRAFRKLAKTEGKIIDGVSDFLKMLRENDIPMAICSGALLPEIEMILEGGRLRSFFEVIVSAEQVKKGKPNPEGFLLTLKKLNEKISRTIMSNECIVVEDSHWGLEAARAAGMHSIAVTNSYDAEKLTAADKIVTKLNELDMDDLRELCI